jgi:hypothetical protein
LEVELKQVEGTIDGTASDVMDIAYQLGGTDTNARLTALQIRRNATIIGLASDIVATLGSISEGAAEIIEGFQAVGDIADILGDFAAIIPILGASVEGIEEAITDVFDFGRHFFESSANLLKQASSVLRKIDDVARSIMRVMLLAKKMGRMLSAGQIFADEVLVTVGRELSIDMMDVGMVQRAQQHTDGPHPTDEIWVLASDGAGGLRSWHRNGLFSETVVIVCSCYTPGGVMKYILELKGAVNGHNKSGISAKFWSFAMPSVKYEEYIRQASRFNCICAQRLQCLPKDAYALLRTLADFDGLLFGCGIWFQPADAAASIVRELQYGDGLTPWRTAGTPGSFVGIGFDLSRSFNSRRLGHVLSEGWSHPVGERFHFGSLSPLAIDGLTWRGPVPTTSDDPKLVGTGRDTAPPDTSIGDLIHAVSVPHSIDVGALLRAVPTSGLPVVNAGK